MYARPRSQPVYLGDSIYANFFLLGAAYQRGLIPLGVDSILEAVALNGVAIEQNQQAFLWGRRYIVDAGAVLDEAGLENEYRPERSAETMDEMIDYRSKHLIDYQDQAYADRYLGLVQRVRQFEQDLLHPPEAGELPLTIAVARTYFGLLAYKDEYEVARLYSSGEFEKALAVQFEGDYRLRFHLAPPLLTRRDPQTGKPLKREFGSWVLPLFRVLARLRKLRGGKFDVFRFSADRKLELGLINDYERTVERLLATTHPGNFEVAVEIAGLPQQIRGFGHVKQASFEDSSKPRESMWARHAGSDPAVEVFKP